MNAPLILAVRDHLMSDGWGVLRFNFRGIGDSEGTAGMGLEEIKDATAAVAHVKSLWPGRPVAIAGWSFGAAVAIKVAAADPELKACIAVAPAVKERPGITAGLPPPDEVALTMPTLFIVGANDDLTLPEDARKWAEEAGVTFSEMRGANHFFWAKYEKLVAEITEFLDGALSL